MTRKRRRKAPRKERQSKERQRKERPRAPGPETRHRPAAPIPQIEAPQTAAPQTEDSRTGASRIEDALRAWRMAEAKRQGVPAFRIFTDQSLKAMAARRPGTAAELLAIPGIGLGTVEKYGAQLFRMLHEGRA